MAGERQLLPPVGAADSGGGRERRRRRRRRQEQLAAEQRTLIQRQAELQRLQQRTAHSGRHQMQCAASPSSSSSSPPKEQAEAGAAGAEGGAAGRGVDVDAEIESARAEMDCRWAEVGALCEAWGEWQRWRQGLSATAAAASVSTQSDGAVRRLRRLLQAQGERGGDELPIRLSLPANHRLCRQLAVEVAASPRPGLRQHGHDSTATAQKQPDQPSAADAAAGRPNRQLGRHAQGSTPQPTAAGVERRMRQGQWGSALQVMQRLIRQRAMIRGGGTAAGSEAAAGAAGGEGHCAADAASGGRSAPDHRREWLQPPPQSRGAARALERRRQRYLGSETIPWARLQRGAADEPLECGATAGAAVAARTSASKRGSPQLHGDGSNGGSPANPMSLTREGLDELLGGPEADFLRAHWREELD